MSSADSPGRSTSKNDTVLIFDLDGTVLSVNSFRLWVMHMLRGRFGALSFPERTALRLCTALAIVNRKLLRHSHGNTKRRLQYLWSHAAGRDSDNIALKDLTAALLKTVRPNLKDVLALVAGGNANAVLTTAAAGEYAVTLGEHLGFRNIIATPTYAEGELPENFREEKRDRTLAWLRSQSWHTRRRIFFTDHRDDLALIRECELIAWLGPEDEIAAIQQAAPQARIVACRNLDASQMLSLVMG